MDKTNSLSNIEQTIREAAKKATDLDSALQDIFMRYLGLDDASKPDVGYKAYGMLAVDVAVRLANMFISLKRDKGLHRVMCDLTFQLNTNEFWQKNATVLLPIMHVCLNTHTDGVMMALDRERNNEYSTNDTLIAASRAAPLELFPVIAYLVGGPSLMLASSLGMKRDLAPYLLG